jgi:hypothetical protein
VPGTLVNDEMKAAVGVEISRRTSFPIDPSDIRRWAVAVYFPEPPPAFFWDPEVAGATVHKGIVAPEDFNPFAWMTAAGPLPEAPDLDGDPESRPVEHDPDATEKRLGITAPGTSHQLNGGLEVEYGARMRPGDVVTSVVRLGGYTERTGKLGPMLFTVYEDSWTNQHDELVKRSRMTLIRY